MGGSTRKLQVTISFPLLFVKEYDKSMTLVLVNSNFLVGTKGTLASVTTYNMTIATNRRQKRVW